MNFKRNSTRFARIMPAKEPYSFLTTARHDGSPHVEFANGTYYYVVTERGTEFERESFTDKDDLLYRLVADITFGMAVDHELRNRIGGQDFRRVMFGKRIELMERVGPEFGAKARQETAEILKENPYDDSLF